MENEVLEKRAPLAAWYDFQLLMFYLFLATILDKNEKKEQRKAGMGMMNNNRHKIQ
jgi:hypothetical protein